MHGERQIGERFHRVILEPTGFKPSPRLIEALAQRPMLVAVAQLAQQAKNFVRPNARLADALHRSINFYLAGNHGLEEQAFKLMATRRTLRVDAATIVFAQHGTRLRSLRKHAFAATHRTHGKTKLLERGCVIARLQLDVSEENAVAAHATGQAQTGSGGCARHRNLQSLRIAKISRAYLSIFHEAIAVQPLGLRNSGWRSTSIIAMSLVTIFTALNPMDAHLIRSRLEAASFHPEIVNELSALSLDGYALAAGGILVQVPDNEVADARALLAADEASTESASE